MSSDTTETGDEPSMTDAQRPGRLTPEERQDFEYVAKHFADRPAGKIARAVLQSSDMEEMTS